MKQFFMNLALFCILTATATTASTLVKETVNCPTSSYVKEIWLIKRALLGIKIGCGYTEHEKHNTSLFMGSKTYVLGNGCSGCGLAVGVEFASYRWGLEKLNLVCQNSKPSMPESSMCTGEDVLCGITVINEFTSYYAPYIEAICCSPPIRPSCTAFKEVFEPFYICNALHANITSACKVTISNSRQLSSGNTHQMNTKTGTFTNNEGGESKTHGDSQMTHSDVGGNVGGTIPFGASIGGSASAGRSSTLTEELVTHVSRTLGFSLDTGYDWSNYKSIESTSSVAQEYSWDVPPGYTIAIERLVAKCIETLPTEKLETGTFRVVQRNALGKLVISDIAHSILTSNTIVEPSQNVTLAFFIGDEKNKMDNVFEENGVPLNSADHYRKFVRRLSKTHHVNKDYISDIRINIIQLLAKYPEKSSEYFELRRGIPLVEDGEFTQFAGIMVYED